MPLSVIASSSCALPQSSAPLLIITLWSKSRGIVSKGAMSIVFIGACLVLLTFSIFQFVTARHTSFRDGDLVALVEVDRLKISGALTKRLSCAQRQRVKFR